MGRAGVGRGALVSALVGGEAGSLLGALWFAIYSLGPEKLSHRLIAPGLALRRLVAAVLGWDSHRAHHDTISGWGPLVALVLVTALIGLWRWRSSRPPSALDRGLTLVAPWSVLAVSVSPAWIPLAAVAFFVAALVLVLELRVTRSERKPLGAQHWSLFLSTPAWLLLLGDVTPWTWPLAAASVAIALARALLGALRVA